MAVQLTLTDITSGYQGTDIQANFTAIEDEFDKVLYRNGDLTVTGTIDMNSQRLVNLPGAINNSDAATLQDVLDQTTEDATSKPATAITIDDAGGYYVGGNLEAALAEDGSFRTSITASSSELNILDGATLTTAELNTLDGVTATAAELNALDGITSNATELNKLDGATWNTANANTVLTVYDSQRIELGGDFAAGEYIVCERIGNTVTISSVGNLSHTAGVTATSSGGPLLPSQFTPDQTVEVLSFATNTHIDRLFVTDGTLSVQHLDWTGSGYSHNLAQGFTISFVKQDEVT